MSVSPTLSSQIKNWLKETSFQEFSKSVSQRIIGQPELELVLGNVYNYLESLLNDKPVNNNMIIAAPSGSGKTETYRALKAYFSMHIPSLPVYIFDLSQITAAGYRGAEPYEIMSPYFNSAIYNAAGLCFLDEFDKKLMPSINSSGIDTNYEAQSNLLTIVEGSDVTNKRGQIVNTENMMFIGLGSFDAFRKSIEEQKPAIGFSDKNEDEKTVDHYVKISRIDMVKSGGSNELLGRFPFVFNYQRLNRDAIDAVITKIAVNLCSSYECELNLEDEFMEALVNEANSEFGCRAIESIIRSNILAAYVDSLKDKQENKQLIITISNEGSKCNYRDYTEEEIRCRQYIEELMAESSASIDELNPAAEDDSPWDM